MNRQQRLVGYRFVTNVTQTPIGSTLCYVLDLPNGETKLCGSGYLFKVNDREVYLRDGDSIWAVKVKDALFYQLDEVLNNVNLSANKVDELDGKLDDLENVVENFKMYLHNLKKK
jgi:hypothetical protein